MIHWSNEIKNIKDSFIKKEMTENTTITNTGNTIFQANIMNISSTGTNANIELRPSGTGGVDVGGKRVKSCSGIESNEDVHIVVPAANTLNMNNRKISNLARPTTDNDAATKSYVDGVKVLQTVNKANITLTRVNGVNATDANGQYCRIVFSNQADKDFIRNAIRARKNVVFYVADGTAHLHKISNISFFETSSSLGATCVFHLPAFWDASKLTSFLNKTSISEFKILSIGL